MKKVLLYMVDFYEYRKSIIDEMTKQGFSVDWHSDEPKLSSFDRILGKISNKYKNNKFDKYFNETLKEEKNKNFDFIVIIFGALYFEKKHLDLLKKYFPTSKIIYYAWDSVANFPKIEQLLMYSDYSNTFDSYDAKKYNSNFLPLFYIDDKNDITNYKYDVSTVMTFFLQKGENLNKVLNALPNSLNKFFYLKLKDRLYSLKLYLFHKKEIKRFKKYFASKPLSKEESLEVFKNSKVIIDCPLKNQNGLTMRTFEALALKKKIITTNTNIINYDFYSPDNIFVVDDSTKKIPESFFESNFNLNYSLTEKYSINNFVKNLMEVK